MHSVCKLNVSNLLHGIIDNNIFKYILLVETFLDILCICFSVFITSELFVTLFGVGDVVLLVLRRLACPVLMNHAREWYRSAADAVPCRPRDLLPQGAARASVGHMRWCVW